MSRRQWVKLYTVERGSFQQLPLLTRAVAAELLKIADDDGTIALGRRAPADAVCFALGAERNERRAVRRHIDLLLADGYIVHDEAAKTLVIPGFPRYQANPHASLEALPSAPTEPPARRQGPPNESPPPLHGAPKDPPRCAQGSSTVRPDEPKCPESLEPLLRAEENRGEKRREEEPAPASTPPPNGAFDPFEYHERHPLTAAVLAAFDATYRESLGKDYIRRGHGDLRGAGSLAHWADVYAHTNGGDASEVAKRVVAHFVRVKCASASPPALSWLNVDHHSRAFDPVPWLEPPRAKKTRARRPHRGPQPVSPASVHAADAARQGPLEDLSGDDFDVRVSA